MVLEKSDRRKVVVSIGVAAVLWFIMFNPWTALQAWFWPLMAGSSVILLVLSFCFGEFGRREFNARISWGQLALGIVIAAGLWGIFWIGDKLSALMFSFSKPQVGAIYAIGNTWPDKLIALQLFFLTGPAEEIFWRGYIQKRLSQAMNPLAGMLVTLAIYTLIHIWSFNFMLIMAALVAGAVWGILYWFKPSWLPSLVLSHSIWDTAVFVLLPIM